MNCSVWFLLWYLTMYILTSVHWRCRGQKWRKIIVTFYLVHWKSIQKKKKKEKEKHRPWLTNQTCVNHHGTLSSTDFRQPRQHPNSKSKSFKIREKIKENNNNRTIYIWGGEMDYLLTRALDDLASNASICQPMM